MDIYRIRGTKTLKGEIPISGAKNAALPIIVASLLAEGETTLENVPDLMDIHTIIKVIEYLGAETEFNTQKNTLTIRVKSIKNADMPLRPGENNAGVGVCDGAVTGALRRGRCIASRRLRYRRAPGRHTPRGFRRSARKYGLNTDISRRALRD